MDHAGHRQQEHARRHHPEHTRLLSKGQPLQQRRWAVAGQHQQQAAAHRPEGLPFGRMQRGPARTAPRQQRRHADAAVHRQHAHGQQQHRRHVWYSVTEKFPRTKICNVNWGEEERATPDGGGANFPEPVGLQQLEVQRVDHSDVPLQADAEEAHGPAQLAVQAQQREDPVVAALPQEQEVQVHSRDPVVQEVNERQVQV